MNLLRRSSNKRVNNHAEVDNLQGDNSGGKKSAISPAVILKALCITLFAFALSTILISPFSISLSSIFGSAEKNDFVTSDLFAQIADQRPVKTLEDRIVIVDIGISGRDEIAEALEIISISEPKSVGVDVNFAMPREDDSRLMEALAVNPGIVLPLGLKYDVSRPEGERFSVADKPFFFGTAENVRYGASNLPTSREGGTVRDYAIDFNVGGESIPSFAVAMAGEDHPNVLALKKAGAETGAIFYPSREFKIIPIEEVADHAEEFTGKYVVVGSFNDASDRHATPINSYMSGVMIHAYSLATILDGQTMKTLPPYIDMLSATVICFILMILCQIIAPKFKGITLRILQVIILIIAVRIGYELYIDHYLISNFTYTFLMVAFGLFAFDIWNGIEALIILIKKKYTRNNPKSNNHI